MATKITNTSELNVTLASANDTYYRTVKISNPVDNLSFSQIQEAFRPAFATSREDSDTTISFFLDDSEGNSPMAKVLMAERVDIEKEVRRFDSAHPTG